MLQTNHTVSVQMDALSCDDTCSINKMSQAHEAHPIAMAMLGLARVPAAKSRIHVQTNSEGLT